jgi:hypothetical protein
MRTDIERVSDQIMNEVFKPNASELRERLNEIKTSLQNDRNHMDKYHKFCVEEYIMRDKDNIPDRPRNFSDLYYEMLRSAFSYSRLREILKDRCTQGETPQRKDFPKIFNKLFDVQEFDDRITFDPELLRRHILEIAQDRFQTHARSDEKILKIYNHLSRSQQSIVPNRVIAVILSARINLLVKTKDGTEEGIKSLYDSIQEATNYGPEAMWEFAEELPEKPKICKVGVNLVCDFLKNIGTKEYVKIDVHMQRIVSTMSKGDEMIRTYEKIVNAAEIKTTNNPKNAKLQFYNAIKLAKLLRIHPFTLDKIIYVNGWWRGSGGKKWRNRRTNYQCSNN